jgi:hypothetical protein
MRHAKGSALCCLRLPRSGRHPHRSRELVPPGGHRQIRASGNPTQSKYPSVVTRSSVLDGRKRVDQFLESVDCLDGLIILGRLQLFSVLFQGSVPQWARCSVESADMSTRALAALGALWNTYFSAISPRSSSSANSAAYPPAARRSTTTTRPSASGGGTVAFQGRQQSKYSTYSSLLEVGGGLEF